MRTRLFTTLALLAAAAILSPAAAHASDERRSPGVGSVDHFRGPIASASQGSAVLPAPPKADPLGNGIGIGAAIGAATGLSMMAWAYNQCQDTCDAPEPAADVSHGRRVRRGSRRRRGVDCRRAQEEHESASRVGGVVAPKRSQMRVTVSW